MMTATSLILLLLLLLVVLAFTGCSNNQADAHRDRELIKGHQRIAFTLQEKRAA